MESMGGRKNGVTTEPNRRTGRNRANGRSEEKLNNSPTWADVPGEELQHFIDRIVTNGACCIFSRSSDGGVLSLTVIYGGTRWRSFPRSGDAALEDMHDILERIG